MAEKILNGFMKGMVKDLNYSLLEPQHYIHAENFRQVSSGFNTTGAIENIKGNKLICDTTLITVPDSFTYPLIVGHTYLVVRNSVDDPITLETIPLWTSFVAASTYFIGIGAVIDITNYIIPITQHIIGGIELRDSIILFTTSNTTSTPTAGRSQIYKVTLSGVSNATGSIELLYDDSLNADGSYLLFSTEHPIKAISRYETPNIQKVYWTDGYNPIRYINTERYCTITQEVYSFNDYWGVDKFEFLPKVTLKKPTISKITTGTISTGMVFYAYQLYLENGAESAISYISDPLHVVEDSDYLNNDLYYQGDGVDSIKSKGFVVNINFSGNNSYDRLKLIRIEYSNYNQDPKIYIASDIPINIIDDTNITITDVGSVLGELTKDEFNISSSEIFICQELATKNNILFAGNIEKKTFTIDDFDARAVRFRNYTEPAEPGGSDTASKLLEYPGPQDADTAITYLTSKSYRVTIPNYSTYMGISSGRTVTNVTAVSGTAYQLWYMVTLGGTVYYTYPGESDSVTIGSINYVAGTDTLYFVVTNSNTIFTMGASVGEWDYLHYITTTYTYTTTGGSAVIEAIVEDNSTNVTISQPIDVSDPDEWDNSGWTNYVENHDGINNYNNPTNDFDDQYKFMYQSNGSTIGAEGPNIIIDFDYVDFNIDEVATTPDTYYVDLDTNGSYKNYSSPLHGGELTWQRDEVYRLFLIFKNTRGQDTEPKWICDLRIPNMVGSTYGVLTNTTGTVTTARRIYPVIKLRNGSWPTDAVSAQVYRVPREKQDRQVVSQCLGFPLEYIGTDLYMYDSTKALNTYAVNNENLIKLFSPEINITKNVINTSNDYLEYLTNFDTNKVTVGGLAESDHRQIVKCTENTVKGILIANDRTTISDSLSVVPVDGVPIALSVGGISFYNYKDSSTDAWLNAKGGSGLVIKYANNSWSSEGRILPLINYKNNCWNSQYGGLTYENRQFNIMLPCSDILYDDNIEYNCEYGDTFITYFDVSTLLHDPSVCEGTGSNYSKNESVYIPLESSINCNLLSTKYQTHKIYDMSNSFMVQEELGSHMFTDSGSPGTLWVFNQIDDMYKYNTVYSQQPLIASKISIDSSRLTETIFDTQIKASNIKINGEFSDSWTKFGVNDTIEVDSVYGPLNAILEYGKSLYFWQDKAFGILSVNERSLIQDNNTSKLVLGTGGILDRYDYISTQKGCEDKFSVVGGFAGVYWIDRLNRSINRFGESLSDLALQKSIKSIFMLEEDLINWPRYISVQDKSNNEILFTLANYKNGTISTPGLTENSLNKPFTLCFNETMDCFTSEYSFVPFIYIPYKNIFLSSTIYNPLNSTVTYPSNLLFVHDVDENLQARNNFYGLYYNDVYGRYNSKLRTVFNPYYLNTKVFDTLFFNGDVRIAPNTTDIYRKNINELIDNDLSPIYTVLFYNDYQTTNLATLVYKTNLERRERTWSTIVPRNAIKTLYSSQSLNPQLETLTPARTDYQERMRDKYLICELVTQPNTTSSSSYRTIIENLGVTYRNSYR